MTEPIRVLLVDDLKLMHRMMTAILESDPEIEVVGRASNGQEAIEMAERLAPQVIIMDIHMPVMDGLEATRHIMQTNPTPILIMSSSGIITERNATFEALRIGALEVMEKPDGKVSDSLDEIGRQIARKVKRFSRVRVIRHVGNTTLPPTMEKKSQSREKLEDFKVKRESQLPYSMVALGASTGGPPILVEILSKIPSHYPLPIAVVQHISSNFTQGFTSWLNKSIELSVQTARHGERMEAGNVYVPPPDLHLRISSELRMSLDKEPSHLFHIPNIDVLFQSMARNLGQSSIAALLTGMGDDGARGLKAIRDRGGMTMAQSEATCAIFGMPKQALRRGGVTTTLSPFSISRKLLDVVRKDRV